MFSVHPAPDAADHWFTGWTGRLEQWYSPFSDSPEWINHQVARMQSGDSEREIFQLAEGATIVGTLVAQKLTTPPGTMLREIHIEPEHRRRGYGRAALAWAIERWPDLVMSTNTADLAHQALFGEIPVRAQNMLKAASTSDAPGTGRLMTEHEFVSWRAREVQGYADQVVNSGLLTAEQALASSIEQFDGMLPDGLHTPDHAIWCIDADGEIAATLWLGHRQGPDTTWVCSVAVAEHHQGKGLGRAAMVLAERAAIAAGDRQVGLNVFAYNEIAVKLYQKLGYRTTHQFRTV